MLLAGPGSQSGVRSEVPGSGLAPPCGGQGGPVVLRLWGVSMDVDHPVGGSTGRVMLSWYLPHLLSTQSLETGRATQYPH